MDEPALPIPATVPGDADGFAAAVRDGLAAADANRTVPYEPVRRWLLSWGTDTELPPPGWP